MHGHTLTWASRARGEMTLRVKYGKGSAEPDLGLGKPEGEGEGEVCPGLLN